MTIPLDSHFEALADFYGREACTYYDVAGTVGSRLLLAAVAGEASEHAAGRWPVVELPRHVFIGLFRTRRSPELLDSLIQAILNTDGMLHESVADRVGFHPNFAVQVNLCWLGTEIPPDFDGDESVSEQSDADPAILVKVHALGRTEPSCHVLQPAFRTAHFQRYRDQHWRYLGTAGRFAIEV